MINRRGMGGAGLKSGRTSVVSVPSLPARHPMLLGRQGAPWRWVALLLPDPHCVVLGHDPVIAGPFKEVTPGGLGAGGCPPSVVVGQPLCL